MKLLHIVSGSSGCIDEQLVAVADDFNTSELNDDMIKILDEASDYGVRQPYLEAVYNLVLQPEYGSDSLAEWRPYTG